MTIGPMSHHSVRASHVCGVIRHELLMIGWLVVPSGAGGMLWEALEVDTLFRESLTSLLPPQGLEMAFPLRVATWSQLW
jgi:hypothetical protein